MGAVSSQARRNKAKKNAKTLVEAPVEYLGSKKEVPHELQPISGKAANPSLDDSLEDHIDSGSFLSNNRKKYWVDEKTGGNCFALVARDLSITWGDDPRYWQWLPMKEAGQVEIEVASLKKVCWLEIHGKLEMSRLTPALMYEIVFVVMISKETAGGWETPVNLRVKFPGGRVEEHKESLLEKPRGRWIALEVCKLKTRPEQAGEMEISLLECESGQWKRGLIVKGVIVRPADDWDSE
ncbi:hypothetical protein OPV22_017369 [Ensete ventricosum]|uniref:Uncharacterized protein n=1 Tax=Ensete ventricosum TaxID=4639 RepID=A0AAV8QN64_ENSVE|nr:hypothetical protein OPV22_017369 [Ensete ventricosum]